MLVIIHTHLLSKPPLHIVLHSHPAWHTLNLLMPWPWYCTYSLSTDSLQVAVSDCLFLVIVNSLHPLLIAERREHSEANNWGLFEIPRYLYIYIIIYIHMSVCTCIAQDRTHLTQVLPRRPIVHCPSAHWLQFEAPLWGVALSIGMADGASSGEDSPDDDSDLGHTRTATGHTGSAAQARLPHRGKKDWQPNDFGIFLSLYPLHIIHVPFHIHHQLTEFMFTLFAYSFFAITHLSNP